VTELFLGVISVHKHGMHELNGDYFFLNSTLKNEAHELCNDT